jgi:hypothetical protein
MTTKHPSRLAASGPVDDTESEQVTKEHNDDDDGSQDITVDPSGDVTVEATEDVTIEAVATTPHPTLRGGDHTPAPGTVGTSAGQRAPTLLGVPISSLPLPGVSASSNGADAFSDAFEDATRSISYDEEVTVLAPAQPAPTSAAADPLSVLDALDRPSITDDDEEETKVEPAEAAMKAAESMDDVTTALSAQASLEREKALRRSLPAPSPAMSASAGHDLEFADPEAEDEEESLDDELDDDDEVISAGGAIEEEDDDDGSTDGVATATFMKPADSTSLSGLLNPRRPPTGNPYGRDGFGARLPTPYPPPQSPIPIPAPSTSPFASRLGPAPSGAPYPGRATTTTGAVTAIQVPPPSGKATTETEPGFFFKKVPVPGYGLVALVVGSMVAGAGFSAAFGGKSTPKSPTVIVAKPTVAPAVPAPPVVEPVATGTPAPSAETAKPAAPAEPATAKPSASAPAIADIPPEAPSQAAPEAGWKPGPVKRQAAPKPHKIAAEEDAVLKPKPAVATAKPAAPKPAMASSPKPAAPPAAKGGKKASKVWVDPFAN